MNARDSFEELGKRNKLMIIKTPSLLRPSTKFIGLLDYWIVACSMTVTLGWLMSSFHLLSEIGYCLEAAILICAFPYSKIKIRRFSILNPRRVLPLLFVIFSLLLASKGFFTSPSQNDGVCYRIPRAMTWIMNGGWVWSGSPDIRWDSRGSTYEWLIVPILLLTKSDHWVFLPNLIGQLFLPSILFSVWRAFKLGSKYAWSLMWLLPSSFVFALQSVDCSNDTIGIFFLLVGIYYIQIFKRTSSYYHLFLSALATALATNVKLTYVPMSLPWFLLAAPHVRHFFNLYIQHPGALALTLLSSYIPQSILNYENNAGFTGLLLDTTLIAPPPLIALVTNILLVVVTNLHPPLIYYGYGHPMNGAWDFVSKWYLVNPFALYYHIAVQNCGLGCVTISALLLLRLGSVQARVNSFSLKSLMIIASATIPLLQFLITSNPTQPARLLCGYYLLLAPLIFYGLSLKRTYSKILPMLTLGFLTLNFGLELTLSEGSTFQMLSFLSRRDRADSTNTQLLNRIIPPDQKVIGMIREWDERASWAWRPYGKRTIKEVALSWSKERIEAQGFTFIIISTAELNDENVDLKDWLHLHNAHLFSDEMEPEYVIAKRD